MAEETEKKFKRIMEKLYSSTSLKSPPSLPAKRKVWEIGFGGEVNVSVKRGDLEDGRPTCRPWDRGDLMRRLATFKAMTWFGKPKVIDAVNCARRGWKNVEMDTLICESCGSRLLFSNPSSWSLQQVEKAAAVFSLKLESGHKLLCPWIDNICDETLAYFPPTPNPVLIEGFKERSMGLLRLSALPIISQAAIELMKGPQLESFLRKGSYFSYGFDGGLKLVAGSESLDSDDVSERHMSSMYHQAHMILSLCGWEPRLVPYVVEKMVDSSEKIIHNQNHPAVISVSAVCRESDEDHEHPSSGHYDPGSVLLECKLCGTCVGLWAFKTVPRPLEMFKLIESPDDISTESMQHQRASSQSLTSSIAGGPRPAKQNFKPRISLPIVARHLRAVFETSDGEARSQSQSQSSTLEKEEKGDKNDKILPGISQQDGDATFPDVLVNDDDVIIPGQSPTPLTLGEEGANNILKDKGDEDEKILLEDPSLNGNPTAPGMVVTGERCVRSESTVNTAKNEFSTLNHDMLVDDADVSIHDQSPETLTLHEEGDNILKNKGDGNEKFLLEDPSLNANTTAPDMVVTDERCERSESAVNTAKNEFSTLNHDMLVDDADVSIHDQSPETLTLHEEGDNSLKNKGDGNEKILLEDPSLNADTTAPDMVVTDERCERSESAVNTAKDGLSTLSHDMLIDDADVSIQSQSPETLTLHEEREDNILKDDGDENEKILLEDPLLNGTAPDMAVNEDRCESSESLINTAENGMSTSNQLMLGNVSNIVAQKADVNKFNPIHQHRPFCPWVVFKENKNSPGWKLTLQALVNDNSSPRAAAALSTEEVNDPILSIRRLFSSPPVKRSKVSD